jgi:hypothetical protein
VVCFVDLPVRPITDGAMMSITGFAAYTTSRARNVIGSCPLGSTGKINRRGHNALVAIIVVEAAYQRIIRSWVGAVWSPMLISLMYDYQRENLWGSRRSSPLNRISQRKSPRGPPHKFHTMCSSNRKDVSSALHPLSHASMARLLKIQRKSSQGHDDQRPLSASHSRSRAHLKNIIASHFGRD